MSTTTGVIPAKLRYYSDALAVEVVQTYGYRFRCKCGERGKVRKAYAEAVNDLGEHRLEAHGNTDRGTEAS